MLDTMGKFVIVSQCSAQSEDYGIRYQDRIIKVNNRLCTGLEPNDVVTEIRAYSFSHII